MRQRQGPRRAPLLPRPGPRAGGRGQEPQLKEDGLDDEVSSEASLSEPGPTATFSTERAAFSAACWPCGTGNRGGSALAAWAEAPTNRGPTTNFGACGASPERPPHVAKSAKT